MANLLDAHLARPGNPPVPIGADDWVVIVSQTCDVVARKIEAEPFVEVLHCKPIDKLRSEYKELRSTRILDFKPNRDTHDAIVLSAHAIVDRYLIPRELLRDRAPDPARRLSSVATTRVLAWYALRYARPAWPDAFVKRICQTQTTIKAALEPLKDDIAEVRISIAEKAKELEEGEDYHVAIFFVVDEDVWKGDVEGRGVINEVFAKFVADLDGCEGIEVDQNLSGVFSGAEFSWQVTKTSDEWNFANLTHRE
jgi:hypothetical protein